MLIKRSKFTCLSAHALDPLCSMKIELCTVHMRFISRHQGCLNTPSCLSSGLAQFLHTAYKMGRGRRFSDDFASAIYRLHDSGRNNSDIGRLLGVNRRTVRRLLQRRIGSTMTQQKVKLGRPVHLSASMMRHLYLTILRNRFQPAAHLAHNYHCSARTVQRYMHKLQVPPRPAFVNVLTNRHRRLRLEWCRSHESTDFRNWLFSDEASFELRSLGQHRGMLVHRKRSEKFVRCCIINNPIQSCAKLMVWGTIGSQGAAPLAFVNGTLNAAAYVDLLNTHLVEAVDSLIPLSRLNSFVFQQDNAPPHRASGTKAWFQQRGIPVAAWPPLSPDLNPIEMLWAAVKRRIRQQPPTSLASLQLLLKEVWTLVATPEECSRLISTLHRRMRNVMRRRGLRTQ